MAKTTQRGNFIGFWLALASVLVAFSALATAGFYGWSGNDDRCLKGGQCFCETDRGGPFRQPVNGLSNLGFVAVGLGIAYHHGRARRNGKLPEQHNPMTRSRFYVGFYAVLVALIGPASMALHASLKRWGGLLDVVAMNLFISFLVLYAWSRLQNLTRVTFAVLYALLNVGLFIHKNNGGSGATAFGILAVTWLVLELVIRLRGRQKAKGVWLLSAAGTFAAAYVIWLTSDNHGTLCQPDSLLQGHAVWHVLTAATTWLIYMYARSETLTEGNAWEGALSFRPSIPAPYASENDNARAEDGSRPAQSSIA